MAEKIFDLSKSYLPTVAIVGVIGTLVCFGWYFGGKEERVKMIEERVAVVESICRENPSRSEFDNLKIYIEKMDGKIDKIMDMLTAR